MSSEVKVDTISEKTSGSGVTIDGLLIKDGGINEASLTLKNPVTADNSTMNLVLQTGETDIAQDDVIGKISFQAPDEGTGTDAVLVAAGIQAVSEGDFSSSSNATSLQFMTGASEAAAEKMTLTSGGVLNVTKLGVGTDHDLTNAGIHIRTADSGASNVNNADDLVIEGSGVAGISIFTGTSSAGQINFGDSGANERGKLLYDHNGDDMDFYTNSSHQWSIDSSGNWLPAATDHGIYLGVNSATAANLLDDYEEGDMTVTSHYAGSGSWNTADNADTLQYTKIGRQVTVTGQIDVDTYSSASGIGYINAPFTCVQGTEYSGSSTGLMRVAGSNGKNVGDFNVHVYEALARIYFDLNTANTLANGALAAFDSSMSIYISVTYNT